MTYQPPFDPQQQPAPAPYPGAQQPGYPQPPPPAPNKRKKWPWIVGGVFLVMVIGCVGVLAVVLGAGKEVVEDLDANVQGRNAVAGQMNTPATDGKFQFTVTGMRCGVESVGSGSFGETAQGEFCLISVMIKNVGKSAEIFNDSSQKAYDAANTEYSVDSGAAIWANKDSSTFLEQINPGNTVKGDLVFDVPQGTKLGSVVLHESAFTAGVRVELT